MGAALAFSLSGMAEARGWDEGMRERLSRAFGAKFEKAEELKSHRQRLRNTP